LPAGAGHRGCDEARTEIRGIHGKSSVALSLLLVATAILAPACAGGGRSIRLADGQRASAHGEADVAGVSSTVIEMDDFFFRPTVLHGTPGQRLTVTLSNQGNSLHDFRIAAEHIDANVEAGTPVTVTVTFPEKGAVTFECRYHLLQNMRGELVTGGGG
jgi:plastocyanin